MFTVMVMPIFMLDVILILRPAVEILFESKASGTEIARAEYHETGAAGPSSWDELYCAFCNSGCARSRL